jgi:hypothetical protein
LELEMSGGLALEEVVDMSQDRLRNEWMYYMFVEGDEVEFTNHNITGFKLFLFIMVLPFTGKYIVLPALYLLKTEYLSKLREIMYFCLFVSNTYLPLVQMSLLFLVGLQDFRKPEEAFYF